MVYKHYDLLALHRPTKVDDLFANVPRPASSLPKRRLPNWELLRLEDKLPIIKAPKGALIFTDGKLGEKLWTPNEQVDFDLSDPYCHQTCLPYNSLHDSHLKSFFAKPSNRQMLCKQGLITPNGDVICSLAQFNRYRRYLSKEYIDQVHNWRRFQDRIAEEKRLLKQAYLYFQRDKDKKVKNSMLEGKMEESRKQQMMKEKELEERGRAQRKLYNKRLQAFERKRAEEALERKERARRNNARIVNRLKAAKKIENARKILVLKRWREDDRTRAQRILQEKNELQSKKMYQEIRHWNQKAKQQILAREKNKHILEQFHEEQYINIVARNKKASESQSRMEAERLIMKEKKRMLSWEKKKQRAIAEAIARATNGCVPHATAAGVVAALGPSAGTDPLHILEGAKTAIDKLKTAPEPVSVAINKLLDNVIATYTETQVMQLLCEVLSKAKVALFGKSTVKFVRNSITIKQKPSIKSLPRNSKASVWKKGNDLAQAVSFGSVTTIGAIIVPGELRSVKERPPTPVPSLTELAEVVFKEPVSLLDIYATELNAERCNLERLLAALAEQLLKAALRRTQRSMDSNKQLLYFPEIELTLESVSEKLTNALLTTDPRHLGDSEEMLLAIDVLVRELLSDYTV